MSSNELPDKNEAELLTEAKKMIDLPRVEFEKRDNGDLFIKVGDMTWIIKKEDDGGVEVMIWKNGEDLGAICTQSRDRSEDEPAGIIEGVRLKLEALLLPDVIYGSEEKKSVPRKFCEPKIMRSFREVEYVEGGVPDPKGLAKHDELLYILKHFDAPEIKEYFEFNRTCRRQSVHELITDKLVQAGFHSRDRRGGQEIQRFYTRDNEDMVLISTGEREEDALTVIPLFRLTPACREKLGPAGYFRFARSEFDKALQTYDLIRDDIGSWHESFRKKMLEIGAKTNDVLDYNIDYEIYSGDLGGPESARKVDIAIFPCLQSTLMMDTQLTPNEVKRLKRKFPKVKIAMRDGLDKDKKQCRIEQEFSTSTPQEIDQMLISSNDLREYLLRLFSNPQGSIKSCK